MDAGDSSERLGRPIRIYLDQADWSHLEDGSFLPAESALRELGESGAIQILVSHEHLSETSGLAHGRESRILFLRGFPGTFLMGVTAVEILAESAHSLVSYATVSRPCPPVAVQAELLSGIPMANLRRRVKQARFTQEHARGSARAERIGRIPRPRKKRDQLESEKNLTAMLRGDWPTVRKYLVEKKGVGPLYLPISRIIMYGLVALRVSVFDRIGLLAPNEDPQDPIFQRVVLPLLPAEVRCDKDALARCLALWKDERLRYLCAPSLACTAALTEAVYRNPARGYKQSDELDFRHGCYAPLVRLFTCDKRNLQPLQKVFRLADADVGVIRTHQLDHLVEILKEMVEHKSDSRRLY